MAYVPVPKDLTAVKTKVLFNLTKRQLVCFSGGALVGVPLFFLLKGPAGFSAGAASLCMVLIMLPFFLMAVYEKNGLPMEKIVRNIARVLFLRPKQRPYQTNNFYAVLARQSKLDKEVCRIVSKKAKTGHEIIVPRREVSDRSRRRKSTADR
ncbi:MAG: PrgI family protein [Ruminococcaceae bacterium]|nr:PrgI family protein [Oscillospiraceae bacterium]